MTGSTSVMMASDGWTELPRQLLPAVGQFILVLRYFTDWEEVWSAALVTDVNRNEISVKHLDLWQQSISTRPWEWKNPSGLDWLDVDIDDDHLNDPDYLNDPDCSRDELNIHLHFLRHRLRIALHGYDSGAFQVDSREFRRMVDDYRLYCRLRDEYERRIDFGRACKIR